MAVWREMLEKLCDWRLWALPAVISGCLIIIAQYSFLGFHTLAELFSIVICFVMFALAWSTRRFVTNNFLLFLACGYFWIGSLDLMHTLVYKGMNVFVEGTGNLAVQFWIIARYAEAVLLLGAPFASSRKQNATLLLSLFGLITVGLGSLIMWGIFPTGFVEGKGLTDFKIYSEYLIILILAIAMVALLRQKVGISTTERTFIIASIAMTMAAELAFTFYVSVYGISNLAGHIFKVFSFWFIFQAIIISNLQRPYAALQQSEKLSWDLFENNEVSIWNEDLTDVCKALDKLRLDGVSDLRRYLEDHEQETLNMARAVKVTHVNEATLKLFRAKDEKELIDQIDQTFGPGAIAIFKDELCAIWNRQKIFRSEAAFQTLDGKEIRTIISFRIPETTDGFQSIPVSIMDITENRLQQAIMEDSELRYRQMFDDNVAVFLIINPDNGAIVNGSIGACNYYGYSLIELVTMNISDINVMAKADIAAEMKRARKEVRNFFTLHHKLASGEIRDVEVYSNPITIDGKTLLFSIIHDISDRKLLESELGQRTHDLVERVKEQTCLYSVSEIFSRLNITVEDALEAVVGVLPSGWQYPDITCARITVDNDNFETTAFRETAWKQSSDIVCEGNIVGTVEVCYLEERPRIDEGPFLREERHLIDSIATRIGGFLSRVRAETRSLNATLALGRSSLGAVSAIAATIEKRDPYTSGHQKNVAQLAVAIAEELGWEKFRIDGLRLGAIIHDIGKIYIPAEILNRPGDLTSPEFEMIKSHPQVGYDILRDTEFPWPIREMVLQHHERVDGSGYPNGLTGDQIVDEAKIIAVADVVEAISAHRPYRAALGLEVALEEIEKGKGTAYDPGIVDSCIKIVRGQEFEWS